VKDEILKSFLATFIEQNDLSEVGEDEAFENFVNYNIVSRLYPSGACQPYLNQQCKS